MASISELVQILVLPGASASTQTYGDSSSAGSATKYAREDHKHGMPASASGAGLGANTFTGNQNLADYQLIRAMQKDCGYVVVDKGNQGSGTITFDYSAGNVQTYTATASTITWAVSGFPPTGNEAYMLIRGTNMGAYTHTITGITWILPAGTTSTTLATYLAANTGRTAFQTSGVDQIMLWTRDAGTTIYGKLI
jgi:hypothetical protein